MNISYRRWTTPKYTDNFTAHQQIVVIFYNQLKQESPAIADKPARRESLPKLLQFDVPTTLSLTILAYLHAFNCCCVRNPRNPEKFTKNSNLWSSRSSKVIDLGANRKPMCDFILVINFSRICYLFEIFTLKIENRWIFTPFRCLRPSSGGTPLDIDVIYTPLKSAFNGLQL